MAAVTKFFLILSYSLSFNCAGIAGDPNYQLECVNSKGMDTALPISKVLFPIHLIYSQQIQILIYEIVSCYTEPVDLFGRSNS